MELDEMQLLEMWNQAQDQYPDALDYKLVDRTDGDVMVYVLEPPKEIDLSYVKEPIDLSSMSDVWRSTNITGSSVMKELGR